MKNILSVMLWLTLECIDMRGAVGSSLSSTTSRDLTTTAPLVHDVASAAAQARFAHCEAPSCKAIIVIDKLMNTAQYEFGDANGVASLYLGKRPEIAQHRLDRALLDHPALYGPVCVAAVKLVSQVHPELEEIFVPVILLVNSVDMDLHDHGGCARALVRALPRDPANDQIRMNARDLCVSRFENQRRPRAACAILIQGVDEKAAVARGLDP